MPEEQPIIEIERIEIVPGIQGRQFCVMAQRVMTFKGKTQFIEPVNLLVGSIGDSGLPQEVQDAIASINTQLQSQVDQLTADLATANTAKQQAESDMAAALEQLQAANVRIAELEAQANPPNPFPNADWQGFRSAALSSPIVLRLATSNITNFVMLLIYMTDMQRYPNSVHKMAEVWNEIEGKTPLATEEIAAINTLAQQFGVPFILNSEGQINL